MLRPLAPLSQKFFATISTYILIVYLEPPPSEVLAFIIGAVGRGGATCNEPRGSTGGDNWATTLPLSSKNFRYRFIIGIDNTNRYQMNIFPVGANLVFAQGLGRT